MLDYIFFDAGVRDRFTAFLRERGVAFEQDDDELGFTVAVPEDLEEALDEAIDARYEALMAEHEARDEQDEGVVETQAAGVTVQLLDGSPCTIRFEPELLARLAECIGMEPLRDLIQAVADQVQEPDQRPLCRR